MDERTLIDQIRQLEEQIDQISQAGREQDRRQRLRVLFDVLEWRLLQLESQRRRQSA